ncbi:hypothetical protein ACQBAR_07280 [Propionibacteriaceae bacterium Y1685]
MPTARTGTYEWRKLREHWQTIINHHGGIECWRPDCHTRIPAGTNQWHLGHTTDHAVGGSIHQTRPECIPCNLHHGGVAGARAKVAASNWPSRAL